MVALISVRRSATSILLSLGSTIRAWDLARSSIRHEMKKPHFSLLYFLRRWSILVHIFPHIYDVASGDYISDINTFKFHQVFYPPSGDRDFIIRDTFFISRQYSKHNKFLLAELMSHLKP